MRAPTARLRRLPDFMVIGAMRSGTSSLFQYLTLHPSVRAPLRKEIHYFTRNFDSGESWYRQHFPVRRHRGPEPTMTFEATPYYMYEPRVPRRAHAIVPNARLIAVLRDPVERAYSDHQHMTRLGFEKLSFVDALTAEPSRLEGELERLEADDSYVSRPHQHYSYLSRGRYGEQLRRWLEYYPRNQLFITESSRLYVAPEVVYAEILTFLGLPDWTPEEFRNHSYVGRAPVRSKLDAGLHRELLERFTDSDAELERITGWAPSWRAPGPD